MINFFFLPLPSLALWSWALVFGAFSLLVLGVFSLSSSATAIPKYNLMLIQRAKRTFGSKGGELKKKSKPTRVRKKSVPCKDGNTRMSSARQVSTRLVYSTSPFRATEHTRGYMMLHTMILQGADVSHADVCHLHGTETCNLLLLLLRVSPCSTLL
jgi:hypothetical protein